MAELSAPLRRRPPHLPVPPRTLGGEGGHLQDGQNRAGATNLHFKRDTPMEKLQPAQPHGAAALLHWQRERHTGYDCRPREPGQHAQDAGVRPSPPHCPSLAQPVLQQGGSFLDTQGPQLVLPPLPRAWKFSQPGKLNLLSRPRSSPEIHVVTAEPF